MVESEGAVKYRLQFILDEPPRWEDCPTLEAWRRILFHLRLIGLDPNRYQGLAYGNVSQRLAGDKFIISATQTGGLEHLGPEHYCLVEKADLAANRVVARGRYPPSSEALTHAAVYQAAPGVGAVVHGHCPEIWHLGERLGCKQTSAAASYGTPALAWAVLEQVRTQPEQGIIVMRGHLDGVLAYAGSPRGAAILLIEALARAWSQV
ncbi:hypothetical protein JCM13664_08120 [Methylothermus subterraneus]